MRSISRRSRTQGPRGSSGKGRDRDRQNARIAVARRPPVGSTGPRGASPVTDTGSRAVSAFRWCDAKRVRTPWREMVLSEDRTNLQRPRGVCTDMIICQRDFPGGETSPSQIFSSRSGCRRTPGHLARKGANLSVAAHHHSGTVPGGRRGADSRRKIRWPSRLFRGISMACEDLVVGCFLDDRAPLAVPELNRERTLKYLECCYKQGMSWKDAEQQIQDCLQQRGVPREGILRQLKLARSLLQPWLD